MSRIVVYTSKTGFTARYAKWIAEELQCEAKELKATDTAALSNFDQVIYGGWIMAGMISGLDTIKSHNLKNLIVFGSGMSAPSEEVRETIAKQNNIELEKCFYFEGGYAPEKVGFFGRMMIKMVAGSVRKKEVKTEGDIRMLETAKGADRTVREAVLPLVEYVKSAE